MFATPLQRLLFVMLALGLAQPDAALAQATAPANPQQQQRPAKARPNNLERRRQMEEAIKTMQRQRAERQQWRKQQRENPLPQAAPWRKLARPTTQTLTARRPPTHRDVIYANVGGMPLTLDLYRPANTTATLPLVVWIHGGGWRAGSKEAVPREALSLVEQGFALASVNYRLTSQAGRYGEEPVIFPAQIHDVKGAVRFLRAQAQNYQIDPERIGVWGSSAGGHLAALLATTGGVAELEGTVGGNEKVSSRVQAAVDYFGPTDLLAMADDRATSGGRPVGGVPPGSFAVASLVGHDQPGEGLLEIKAKLDSTEAPYPALKVLLGQASPMTHVSADDAPMLIAHGEQDRLVPPIQSQRLYNALKAKGIKVELMMVPGAGHGILGRQAGEAALRFLGEQLKGKPAPASPANTAPRSKPSP